MELKTFLITQARKGSTRLPFKILKKIGDKEILQIHLERLERAKLVDKIIVATTSEPGDEEIAQLVQKWGFDFFRGSENDVLDRYYKTIMDSGEIPHWVVRVTSDCPLIDPNLVDEIIEYAQSINVDYVSNTLENKFPDGQDIEVFKFSALKKSWKEATLKSEREHVTPFIKNNSDFYDGKLFKAKIFPCDSNYSDIRMTVDEIEDFILIEKLINDIGADKSWLTYTNYIIDNNLMEFNKHIIRNEGYLKSIKNEKNE